VHPVRLVDFGGVYPEQGADFGCGCGVDVVVSAESEPRGAWVFRHEQYLNVGVVTYVSDQFFEVTFNDCA
jgi:hypothetical protein